ncbi:DUF3843 family protein [Mariniflexile ostreae]|uniref:DUF3843 family protein n=1 Tax=Mariniflexile ostreae TaxID=1520892 RepID=A0ABV5F6T0_9FLAO
MKNKIYIKHWLSLKPQNYSGKTDLYYLKIANKISDNFNDTLTLTLSEYMSKDERAMFCCFLACYFEDIISETNIWFAFKSMHQSLYNKPLPFYDIEEDYINDEVNFEDVAFLSWYFLNTIQSRKFISPFNDFILDIATLTMQVLDEAYEYAPENKTLKEIFQFNGNPEEFYEIRAFMQTVFFESYLFNTDIKYQLDIETLKIIEDTKDEAPNVILSYIREVTEELTFNKSSALMAMKASDWSKAIMGTSHKNYGDISSISEKISGLFLYKKQNTTSVFLEHIASGMSFEMTKKSFDDFEDLKTDEVIFIGLVRYKNEWWFSGNSSIQDFDANLILDQKNSADARAKVNFLNDPKQMESVLNKQKNAFLEFNDNALIAYMKSNKVEEFSKNFITYYNQSLNLSAKKKKEALQRAKDDGFFGKEDVFQKFKHNEEKAIVFFNPKNGIEIYFDIINAFPDKNNPFFTKESEADIMRLLISPSYSTELVQFFINTFKDKLKFFKKEPNKSYLEDMDFLLRFWKKNSYVTKSNIILTGKTH